MAKSRHGCTDDERPVDIAAQLRRLPDREQDGDGNVEDEEQNQEGLGAIEQAAVVVEDTPYRADDERKGKAHEIQRTPRLVPGNHENAHVQYEVVAEQGHVTALPVRRENRRKKPTGYGEDGERLRVLQHC